jgi:hypothetical protein
MDSNHRPDGKQPLTLPLSYQGIELRNSFCAKPVPQRWRDPLTSMLEIGDADSESGIAG